MNNLQIHISSDQHNQQYMFAEIETFLSLYCVGKSEMTRRQTERVLSYWEKYIVYDESIANVTREEIDQFIYGLFSKKLKTSTLIVYLFHFAKFFKEFGRKDLQLQIEYERQELRETLSKELEENPPETVSHHDVLKLMTTIVIPRDKLLLRLLLFNKIPFGCIGNLKVRDYVEQTEEIKMQCCGKMTREKLYLDTPEIIRELKGEMNRQSDAKLIGITERQINNVIRKYAEKIGTNLTSKSLRMFSSSPQKEMLVALYYSKLQEDTRRRFKRIGVGNGVGIIAGPFRGCYGIVSKIDRAKWEVTLRGVGNFTLPVTLSIDHVEVTKQAKKSR